MAVKVVTTNDKNNKKAKEGSFLNELKQLVWYQWIFLLVLLSLWIYMTPIRNIQISIYCASAFYIIETIFCTAKLVKSIKSLKSLKLIVFSTPEQFIINVLFIPYLLPWFSNTFEFLGWIRYILTPIFIWILEIVGGYALIATFGYNRAWQYNGKDALFDGNIKLSYFPLWITMGFGFYFSIDDMIKSMHFIEIFF